MATPWQPPFSPLLLVSMSAVCQQACRVPASSAETVQSNHVESVLHACGGAGWTGSGWKTQQGACLGAAMSA